MASDLKFIEHMHMNKGAFGKKAAAAGESTSKFASDKQDAPGKTGMQARLAKTLGGLRSAKC